MSELIGACARGSSRRLDPLQALSLSAALLLALFPGWAGDLGFQLSCVATLGLVTVGSWSPAVPRPLRGAAAALTATLGAQVVSLPLVLGSFHLLPWVAPVANLLAVPIAGWLLSAAWLALVADLAVPGLGRWWFGACNLLSSVFAGIVERAARVPGAARAAGHDGAVLVVAAAGAALLVLARARRRPPAAEPRTEPPSRAGLLGATLSGCALVLAAWGAEMRAPAGRAWLVVLDVGQGDAIALGFADGWWLVDAGARAPRFDAGDQVVLPFLRWAGVAGLEGLAITHDDSDHCGGAPAVLRGIPTRQVIVPAPLPGAPPPLARFHGVAARAGDRLHEDPPLAVLWPPLPTTRFAPATGVTADNAGGLVLALRAGTGSALLLADVDSTVEARLPVSGATGVLKVGHHGSATSSGASFLARARPEFAVVSCGRHNRFGHPDPGAVARLVAAGAAIERTDAQGAVWFELNGEGARVLNWARGDPQPERAPPSRTAAGTTAAPRRP